MKNLSGVAQWLVGRQERGAGQEQPPRLPRSPAAEEQHAAAPGSRARGKQKAFPSTNSKGFPALRFVQKLVIYKQDTGEGCLWSELYSRAVSVTVLVRFLRAGAWIMPAGLIIS